MWTLIGRAAGALAVSALCTMPAIAQQSNVKQAQAPAVKTKAPASQPAAGNRAGQADSNQRPLQRTANKPVLDQSPAQIDGMIAGMLALCNEEEATIGKFAATHAQHDGVKKFANMMAKEHADMAKQLQKWATLAGHEVRTTNSNVDGAKISFDPMQVHQEIASRSIASAEKSLTAKKGMDFDLAYVGSQCVVHQQMIDKASVLRQYASPELQAAIDKGIQSTESHLEQSHRLIDTLAQADKGNKKSD